MLEGPDEDRLRKWAKDLAAAAKKERVLMKFRARLRPLPWTT